MKNFLFLIFAVSFSVSVYSQPQMPQTIISGRSNPTTEDQLRQSVNRDKQPDGRFDTSKGGIIVSPTAIANRTATLATLSKIYDKPSDKQLKPLLPEKDVVKSYSAFLRQSGTGITRLIADKGCADSPDVLNVSDECLKYAIPGAGSSFSFRTENYRIRRLSDLTFENGSFNSFGILSHAILVNVGDVPLENITLQTNGVEYLNNFQPVVEFEKAKELDKEITNGVEKTDFYTVANSPRRKIRLTFCVR